MKILNYGMAVLAVAALTLTSCDPDPDPIIAPVVSTITAEGSSFADGSTVTKDLNGASSAEDVALNSTITINLDKAVDVATVNVSSVSISDGSNDVAAGVSATGSTITIDPADDLVRGTTHTLTLSGIKSSDGGTLASISRTFVTEGRAPVVVPNAESQIAYWNFDNQADDQVGSFNPDNIVEIEYGVDRFGQGASVATFDGNTSIIEIPGADALMDSDSWTLSYWAKTNSDGHINQDGNPAGHFVMGLGAFFGFQTEISGNYDNIRVAAGYSLESGASDSETLFFNGNEQNNEDGGWQGTTFTANLGEGGMANIIQDKWFQCLFTYEAGSKIGSLYLNGVIMETFDFNLWPDCASPGTCKQAATGVTYRDSPNDVEPILALGFIKSIDSPMWASEPWGDYNRPTSNHYKGDLDDIRIFSTALSADEVSTLYNSEK